MSAASCACGHTAHWHSHDGAGACEHDGECRCERFSALPDRSESLERLWACHDCQMIGTAVEGKAHQMVHDHDVVRLTQEESDGVRAIWWEDQAKRAVGFALATRNRGPFADAWKRAAVDEEQAS